MPRTKGEKVNKMAAVREILKQNPHAKTKEIVAALKQQGIEMNDNTASNYRYAIRGKSAAKRRKAQNATAKVVVASERLSHSGQLDNGMDNLLKAAHSMGWGRIKKLVDQIVEAPK